MRKHLSRRKQTKRRATKARKHRATGRKHRGGMMDYTEAVSGRQLIDSSMIPAAATGPLDAAMAEARALAAMSSGKRKGRKASRRTRSRKASRKQRGGEQEYAAPSMLLPAGMYNDAGLNPEWKQY